MGRLDLLSKFRCLGVLLLFSFTGRSSRNLVYLDFTSA